MTRKLRVYVDHAYCVGNAMCVAAAPKVFQHNAERQSEVVNPGGDTSDKILEAASNCPTGAIHVWDDETGDQLFPKTY